MSTSGASWAQQRRRIVRDSVGIGIAVGAFGLSFGALAVAAGFSIAQTVVLSAVMFTGGSQFAYIGVFAAGGGAWAAGTAALLLGARNTVYGMGMAPVLRLSGIRRVGAAQLTIDESYAMSVAAADGDEPRAATTAFWATGLSVYVGWNVATLVGAVGAASLGDPASWGLDAMVPAAFLALLWPRLRDRRALFVALLAAVCAVGLLPFVPAGVPILVGGAIAGVAAMWWSRS